MRYSLFDTMKGVIIERTPYAVKERATLAFNGAREGDTLMSLSKDGASFYRKLDADLECSLPITEGITKIYIKRFGTTVKTWECEAINAIRLKDGQYLVCPADMDIPTEIVRIQEENQRINDRCASLEDSIRALNRRIDDMLDGWGIT